MTKPEILALSDEELLAKVKDLTWRDVEEETESLLGKPMHIVWNPINDIGVAMTDLFESVYGRGGKIKGGSWVLSTVGGGRDVAVAVLFWKAKSGDKNRVNKVTVIRPRGEMAKAITQAWVCGMLGVSDE